MSEYDSEPVLGLPEHLPAGEMIVWQGQPSAVGLARRALWAPYVIGYFGLLAAWSGAAALSQGAGILAAMVSAGWLVLLGLAAITVLGGIAWAMQRSTIYTITNRRIVLRYGVALPMAVNVPFNEIQAAGLRTYSDGSGDITLQTEQRGGLAYLFLWPHVRPWHVSKAEPMLRCIPNAEMVSAKLGRALAAGSASDVSARAPLARPNADWRMAGIEGVSRGVGAGS